MTATVISLVECEGEHNALATVGDKHDWGGKTKVYTHEVSKDIMLASTSQAFLEEMLPLIDWRILLNTKRSWTIIKEGVVILD